MTHSIAMYYPALVSITDDLISAILLSRIIFWFEPNTKGLSKLRVSRNGDYWLVKNREDWLVECGLTRRQVDRGMAKLKKLGLIETEVHRFGGKLCTFIRLVKHQTVLLNAPNGAMGNAPNGAFQGTGSTKKTTGEPPVPTAKDVLEEMEGQKKDVLTRALEEGKKNTLGLCREWQMLVPYYHDLGYVMPAMTMKQQGLVANFRRKVGVGAHEIMAMAVREWNTGLTQQVYEDSKFTLPDTPNLFYLVKYAESALRVWTAATNPAPVSESKSPSPKKRVIHRFIVGDNTGE